MFNKPVNLVFEGGGALGIAYLGVLHYLYQNNILQNVKRVAGTSAGAITACITSFNLPYKIKYYEINSLINFVKNLHLSQLNIQQDILNHSPQDIQRSIQIFTGNISPVDFDISTGDETYYFLYNQGYKAAKIYSGT